MNHEHLLLDKLNHALDMYSKDKTNGSYHILFPVLQKANEILLENNISIFNPEQEINTYYANLNGLGEFLSSSIKARNIIWEDNLGLVGQIAKKYTGKFPRLEYGDIKSEGIFGLLKAIEKYNPDLNVPFPHYALATIDRHVKRNLHKYLRTIRLPINFTLNYQKLSYFENRFKEEFNRIPDNEELAEFMGKLVKRVKTLKENKEQIYNLMSLNVPVFEKGDEDYLIDRVIDKDSSFIDSVLDRLILQDFIQNYISKLPEKHKSVLLKRLKNKSLEEIAKCVNTETTKINELKRVVSKEAIRLREAAGLKKLREMMG